MSGRRYRPGLVGGAWLAIVGLLALLLFLPVDSTNPLEPRRPLAATAIIIAIVGLVVAVAVHGIYRVFTDADTDARSVAARLGTAPEQRLLVERWLARSRWYRNLGGVTGVLAGFLVGNLGGMILFGLIGMTAGSLLAEVHLLTPDRAPGTPRTADLQQRSVARYQQLNLQLGLIAIGVGAVGLGAIGVGAVPAVGLVLVAFALQWRVATRPRPALPSNLRDSDDLIRSLAINRGIATPVISLGLGLLGQATVDEFPALSFILWVAAIAVYWRYRRLGLDHLLNEPPLSSPVAAG